MRAQELEQPNGENGRRKTDSLKQRMQQCQSLESSENEETKRFRVSSFLQQQTEQQAIPPPPSPPRFTLSALPPATLLHPAPLLPPRPSSTECWLLDLLFVDSGGTTSRWKEGGSFGEWR
jgi:hypothetical protein